MGPSTGLRSAGPPALLAAALAFTAGFADGQSYLSRHLFGANMTGNTVLLGIAATTGDASQALAVLVPIAAFIAGCAIATVGLGRSQSVCFGIEAAVLAAAAFCENVLLFVVAIVVAIGFATRARARSDD